MTTPPPPTLPGDTALFGPGEFTVGATGSEISAGCYVNSLTVSADASVGDAVTKLCGAQRAGAVDIQYKVAGNLDSDLGNPDGLVALSWEQAGTVQDFTFTPNTDAVTKITGKVIITPLAIGGDTYGETMVSDFDWSCEGKPTITFPPAGP